MKSTIIYNADPSLPPVKEFIPGRDFLLSEKEKNRKELHKKLFSNEDKIKPPTPGHCPHCGRLLNDIAGV